MKQLCNYIIFFVIGIVIGITIGFEKDPIVIPNTSEKIIRDSIYIVNDSIITKIVYLEKEYDKTKNNIMSADDSTVVSIFSKYINCYNRTNENSESNIR